MSKLLQAIALLLFLAVQMHTPVHQLEHLPGGDHYHDLAAGGDNPDAKRCHHGFHSSSLLTSPLSLSLAAAVPSAVLTPVHAPSQPRLWRSQWAQGPPSLS